MQEVIANINLESKLQKVIQQEKENRALVVNTLIQIILQCPHKHILEAPYEKNTYIASYPPFRVCQDCGYAEEGWGCGFGNLQTKEGRLILEIANREDAEKFIRWRTNNSSLWEWKFKQTQPDREGHHGRYKELPGYPKI